MEQRRPASAARFLRSGSVTVRMPFRRVGMASAQWPVPASDSARSAAAEGFGAAGFSGWVFDWAEEERGTVSRMHDKTMSREKRAIGKIIERNRGEIEENAAWWSFRTSNCHARRSHPILPRTNQFVILRPALFAGRRTHATCRRWGAA